MCFDWCNYLHLAKELAGQATNISTDEAKLRSSISRAYYASYCKSRNYLIKLGYSIPDENAHRFVINKFKEKSYMSYKKIGTNLDRIIKNRVKADYNDIIDELDKKVKETIKISNSIISLLDGL